jgi:hypothetical protein
MRWIVTVTYLTPAGVLREHRDVVDTPDARTAERYAVRIVMRQQGREVVGTEIERA